MMIKPSSPERSFQSQATWYGLIFALALALRLLNLGRTPLNEAEARWAFQALELSRGHSFIPGAQPAYIILTGILFFLFNSSNGLARFLPALAGSLLVFLPLLFQRFTGRSVLLRRAGWVLALGLALDPGLTAISRQAGSSMMAISLGLLALGLVYDRRTALAGICAGLALLSGPALLQGALGLGLSLLLMNLLEKAGVPGLSEAAGDEATPRPDPINGRRCLAFAAGTVLIVGTALLRFPQGLAALADIFSDYIQGWLSASGVPALLLPAAILLYQPLAIVLGLIAVGRAWFSKQNDEAETWLGRLLGIWVLIALALGMLLPARQVQEAAWALAPLLGLAALELAHYLPLDEIKAYLQGKNILAGAQFNPGRPFIQGTVFIPVAAGQAVLLVFFSVLAWHNLLRLSVAQAPSYLYAAVLGGILLMTIIITLLVGAGWSIETTTQGVLWGIVLVLGFYTLLGTWRASQLPFGGVRELWIASPASGQVQELLTTLTDLSSHKKGQTDALDVTIAVPSASLQWALRQFNQVSVVDQISPDALPYAIITSKDQLLTGRAASYRGQTLVWRITPGWSGLLPPNLLRWITYREAPETATQMILWVRNDLFPGGTLNPPTAPTPAQNNPEQVPANPEPSK